MKTTTSPDQNERRFPQSYSLPLSLIDLVRGQAQAKGVSGSERLEELALAGLEAERAQRARQRRSA